MAEKNWQDLVKERAELQREYREYIAKNGFDYKEYVTPEPGSFMEKYKNRTHEIDQTLAPELDYYCQ